LSQWNVQIAKDHELRQAVGDYKTQLDQITQSLAEFKHRALNAEVISLVSIVSYAFLTACQLQLQESTTDASRTQELEREVKEKNLLIGKLRHEGLLPLLLTI
jgi:hypothetical protein